jgi:hypothetical protein
MLTTLLTRAMVRIVCSRTNKMAANKSVNPTDGPVTARPSRRLH